MNIFIPFTKISDATLISLRGYNYIPIKVKGKYGYCKFFRERWDDGEDFINIEHDCVIWPGAIEDLKACPKIWCGYDYSSITDWESPRINSVPLGCVKITQDFIKRLPNIWNLKVGWYECDTYLFNLAKNVNIQIHQHFPGIVNANKKLLK